MSPFRLAVSIAALGEPFRSALKRLCNWGVQGAEWDAVGELAPEALSQTGRKELRHLLEAHQLSAAGVRIPLSRGLDQAEGLELRLERLRRALQLAYDVGSRIVLVDPGTLPDSDQVPSWQLLRDALETLGRYGERVGAVLAVETGPTSPAVWRQFLDRLQSEGLGVLLDPATLIGYGFEPEEAVGQLHPHIRYVQARESRRGSRSHPATEVPLGHGHVDWIGLLEALRHADYRGWLAVKCQPSLTARQDIEAGLRFLRQLIG